MSSVGHDRGDAGRWARGPRPAGAGPRAADARPCWFKRHWRGVAAGAVVAGVRRPGRAATHWYDWVEKRVLVVEPGQLVRGGFQRPGPLRRVIAREHIRTIVTLSGVGEIPDRFAEQAEVVRETGVGWKVVPILGSRPSLEQMAEASDLLADRQLRPVFFHCVAGHHRTSLALAAYRIRHEGWTAARAWAEISASPGPRRRPTRSTASRSSGSPRRTGRGS